MAATGTVRVRLADLPVGASLRLYEGCTTLLAAQDRAGTASEEIIRTLPAGTYAVKVTPTAGGSMTPYALQNARLGAELSLPDPGADALVWCAREALRKATGDDGGPLTWERAGPERSALLVAGGLRVLAATQVVAGLGPVGCAVALGEER
jgi:hypothetical protein